MALSILDTEDGNEVPERLSGLALLEQKAAYAILTSLFIHTRSGEEIRVI